MKRLLLVVLVSVRGAAQGTELSPVAFLRDHCSALETDRDGRASGAGLIDPVGGRVFLLGEVHGVARNNELDFALLRYFHDVAGIRFYLAEVSHAHAWWLNRFLETGDEANLDLVFGQMRGFVDGSRERRAFLVGLRQWNAALPPAERVRVIGFDLERMPGISFACLQCLLAGRKIPPELPPAVTAVLAALGSPTDQARPPLAALGASVQAQRQVYVGWLGERDFFDFALALDNLLDRERCLADRPHFDLLRDRVMAGNFSRLAAHEHFTRIYGRVGSAHVLQHPTRGIDHFSGLLNQPGAEWAGSVVGIWPLYQDSRHLAFARGQADSVPCTDDQAGLAPFTAAAPGDLTLFRLTGRDSPFARGRLIPTEATEGVTTDYFQYAVLIRQGGPATPLELPPVRPEPHA